MRRSTSFVSALVVAVLFASGHPARIAAQTDGAGGPFEQVLDLYVRDGLVYYRALKQERARLDRYVASLEGKSLGTLPRNEQVAFWLNAYNALVLKTVIDQYPIRQRTKDYPSGSIRQLPGAFERQTHHVAGQTLTLDQIEQTMLSGFRDPRLYLAIGRGAMGSGRLRSEPFTATSLERQLVEVASECLTRATCINIDRSTNVVSISALFSWRQQSFVDAYTASAASVYSSRSPIERAVLAFAEPRLLTTEREFLAGNQFKVEFAPFDWALNDLTGRGGR